MVQKNVNNCPHCGADVTSLPVHISVETPREKGLFSRILDSFELTMKEFVMILVLWVLFNFLSYISYIRTEATNLGYTLISHYGVPLEWLEVIAAGTDFQARNGGYERLFDLQGIGIAWAPLILDLTIYFLLAFFMVYGAVKLRLKR